LDFDNPIALLVLLIVLLLVCTERLEVLKIA
jgi:hypothetical protein